MNSVEQNSVVLLLVFEPCMFASNEGALPLAHNSVYRNQFVWSSDMMSDALGLICITVNCVLDRSGWQLHIVCCTDGPCFHLLSYFILSYLTVVC